MKKKVLIIGGTGFLGYHVCLLLLVKGYEVITISIDDVPSGFLPKEVKIIKKDIKNITDKDLAALFKDIYGFVFAAGLDDRVVLKAPAYPSFYEANVTMLLRLLKIAKSEGVKKCVVFNSYFTYFDRKWPEMKLKERHPYIRSRVEQEEEAFKIGDESMPIAVLELPYIVGVTPTKGSLWTPLVKYANSGGINKIYTNGGTAVTCVESVAIACVHAMERTTQNTAYSVVDVNLSWGKWLQSLVKDKNRKLKVYYIPNFLLKIAGLLIDLSHKIRGKEAGLKMVHFANLQTKNTFLPIKKSNEKLDYLRHDISKSFEDTIDLGLKS